MVRTRIAQGTARGSACQLGQQSAVGSLEPGKQASFVILPRNRFELEVESISDVNLEAMFLDGSIVTGKLYPGLLASHC